MLGYLASEPEAEVEVCVVCSEGVVWDYRREVEVLMMLEGGWGGGEGRGCFYRSRRVTTLEPQETLAAVSSGGRESKFGRCWR